MKRRSHSQSVFLMEIVLNILIFSMLLTICLQLVMKARRLTGETVMLHRAVTCCNNAASIYRAGDGSFTTLQNEYTYSVDTKKLLIVYLDDHFVPCRKGQHAYTMTIAAAEALTDRMDGVTISCQKGESVIYSMEAYRYTPLTPGQEGRVRS